MTLLEFLLGFLAFVVALGTIIDVFGRHFGGWKTAAWVLAVLVFPLIGGAVYWLRRGTTQHEVDEAYLARTELQRESERRPFG